MIDNRMQEERVMKRVITAILTVCMLFIYTPLYAFDTGQSNPETAQVIQAQSLSGDELGALASLEANSPDAASITAGEMSDTAIVAITVISIAVIAYAANQ